MERVLIGAGGFAREIIADIGTALKCFVNDEYWESGLFKLSELNPKKHSILIAIGDPFERCRLAKELSDFSYWSHISKHAIILSPLKSFGLGSIICAGSIITTNVSIANHVHINLSCTIGHDTFIDDFVTLSPSTNISGNVNINKRVFIGTNSSVREKISIDSDIVIGLNSGVINPLSEKGVYGGTPCKKIKGLH